MHASVSPRSIPRLSAGKRKKMIRLGHTCLVASLHSQLFVMCVMPRWAYISELVCVCVCVCVRTCVRVVHLHCSAQLSMFDIEKRYRNEIIIIICIIIIIIITI